MEPRGLVSRVGEELERMIALGQLPEDGFLPSEQTLARRYGVSRTTVRQALGQLAARGRVVQRAGRKSRAVTLEEAVTLENLGVAVHAQGPAHPQSQRLLEGFLELQRQTTVELFAACCEHACEADRGRLREACFALQEAARWQHSSEWARQQFELLRLAAQAANRPGHLLLVQSLERSFWAMAERLLPHLDAQTTSRWAQCALHALSDRDAQALRQEGLSLLQAGDERLLHSLGHGREAADTVETPSSPAEPLPVQHSQPEAERDEPPAAACPNLSTCPTGSFQLPPAGPPPEPPAAAFPNLSTCPTGWCPVPEGVSAGAAAAWRETPAAASQSPRADRASSPPGSPASP